MLRLGAGGDLMPAGKLQASLAASSGTRISKRELSNVVLASILAAGGATRRQLIGLVELFEFRGGQYQWRPRVAEIPGYVGLRNTLMELGVIDFDPGERTYVLRAEFLEPLLRSCGNRQFTAGQIRAHIDALSKIGADAELAVLDYERRNLEDFPSLASRVQHIALENATAGFDVLSYERPDAGTHQEIEKLIEVKAVSFVDWRFHWSRNEISKAREVRDSYYLYLVPIACQGVPSMPDMRVIRDPYPEIFDKPGPWTALCGSFEIWCLDS